MKKGHNPLDPPRHPAFDDPKLRGVMPDPRYQNMNASRWCFATFVDYKRCLRLLGQRNDCCDQLKKIYQALCPHAWVAQWEDQIAEDCFQVDLPPQRNPK